MNKIEDLTGKCLHETHGDLEAKAWQAIDDDNAGKKTFFINKLAKIVDELN